MDLLEAGNNVLEQLNQAGYEAFFVGGMVRDRLLGLPLHDVDICTSAMPQQVTALFSKVIPTGLAHGTVTVLIKDIPVEVTTYRIEGEYEDFRRPDRVVFTASLEADLRRRDFTINAMAMDKEGRVFDPMQGAADLRSGRIRAVGNARQRFFEDPLRMLRALRFVSKLGFFLEGGCRHALSTEGHLLKKLSLERVMKELEGLMQGKDKIRALELFKDTGLMGQIPDFIPLERFEAGAFEPLAQGLDLFILAAFYHPDLGAYLKAWPFSRAEKKLISYVVGHWKENPPLKWIQYQEGQATVAAWYRLKAFFKEVSDTYAAEALPINSRKELALSAKSIMEAARLVPGPKAGKLLAALERAVVLGEIKNELPDILGWIGENHV